MVPVDDRIHEPDPGEAPGVKSVLFAMFPDRRRAVGAARVLASAPPFEDARGIRLHEDQIDPMLGVELSGTATQGARERNVAACFGIPFAIAALLGVAIDVSGVFGDTGLSATMALGCVGIVLGTLRVVMSTERPLDAVLDEAGEELRSGKVLMTVEVDPEHHDQTAAKLDALGAATLYRA